MHVGCARKQGGMSFVLYVIFVVNTLGCSVEEVRP